MGPKALVLESMYNKLVLSWALKYGSSAQQRGFRLQRYLRRTRHQTDTVRHWQIGACVLIPDKYHY